MNEKEIERGERDKIEEEERKIRPKDKGRLYSTTFIVVLVS